MIETILSIAPIGSVLLLAMLIFFVWPKSRKSTDTTGNLAAVAVNSSNNDADALGAVVDELITELQNTAQNNIAELTDTVNKLTTLIAQADERIAALQTLEQAEVGETTSHASSNLAAGSGAVMAEVSPLTLAESARRLAQETTDEVEIAKRLGIGLGEVRLLLSMQENKPVGTVAHV